jgi:5-methyltetrahydrofolate--homocysteine methyltransferase
MLQEADFRGERFAAWHKDLRGNNDVLALTRPDIIQDLHAAYLEAGADILETNTFTTNAIAMADYGLESLAREQNMAAARIARSVADAFESAAPTGRAMSPAYWPTNRAASMSPDVNDPVPRDHVRRAGRRLHRAAEALIGVDLLMIETIFDTLNAKAAIFAIEDVFERLGERPPCDDLGHHHRPERSYPVGPDHRGLLNSMAHARPLSIGLNCALGAKDLRPYVQELSRIARPRQHASQRRPA